MNKQWIIVFLLFFLIIGIVVFAMANPNKPKNNISIILNVNDFYKTAGQTLTVDELQEKIGKPTSTETWNYTKSDGSTKEITTLSYLDSNYDYLFYNNNLVRIDINTNLNFNSIDDIFTMFGLTKYDSTRINNTGTSIRIHNSSVPDFWCNYDDQKIQWVKITFLSEIFD